MGNCERCGRKPPVVGDSFELNDYCGLCMKTLCAACMKKGCCGEIPAISGTELDFGGDDED